MLAAKGVHVFAVIDQAEQARQLGLDLRETVLRHYLNSGLEHRLAIAPIADALIAP